MPSWLPVAMGMIAGTLSTFAFVPQVLKIWREGDTHAISLRMYLMRVTGFVLWLWYGVTIGSAPIVIFNVVSLLLGGTVLAEAQGRRPSGPLDWNRPARPSGQPLTQQSSETRNGELVADFAGRRGWPVHHGQLR